MRLGWGYGLTKSGMLAAVSMLAAFPADADDRSDLCGVANDPDAIDTLLDDIVSIDHGAWYVRYLNGYAEIGSRPIVAEPEPREDGGFIMSRGGDTSLRGRPAAGAEPSPEPPYWRPILGPASMTVTFDLAGSDTPMPTLQSVETDSGERIDPPFTMMSIAAEAGCFPAELPRFTGEAGFPFPGAITDIDLIMTGPERMVGVVRDSAPAEDTTFIYHVELTPAVDPPIRDEPLTVVETRPPMDRENVDFESPPITVQFSEDVVAETVSENFTVETRAPDGQRLFVPGTVTGADTDFTFEPNDPLEPGVRYRATITGGSDGVENEDGAHLDADHWWDFSTVVDLGTQADDDNRFSLNVYQTSRNAPLVRGKPTVTRMGVTWDLHEHIEPAWQVEAFPAEIALSPGHPRVQDQFGEWQDVDEDTVIRVRHPDEVDSEQHRRMARTTVNFYGWRPSGNRAADLAMTLTAHDVYPDPRPDLSWDHGREAPIWQTTPENPFTLRWVVLNVGEWSESVPVQDLSRVTGIINDATDFTTQVFPVVETANVPLGTYSPGDTVAMLLTDEESVFDAISQALSDIDNSTIRLKPASVVRRMLLRMGRYFAGQVGPNEVLVAFHPLNYLDDGMAVSGARVHPDESDSGFNRRVVRMPVDTNPGPSQIARTALAQGVVHETAHVFGLHHYPGQMSEITARDEMGEYGGIEGFRIRRDGMEGWNKSSTEGNQQHDRMFPLMFPAIRPLDQVFILDRHYDQLLDAFSASGSHVQSGSIDAPATDRSPLGWPLPIGAAHADTGAEDDDDYSLMISGAIRPDGSRAMIENTDWQNRGQNREQSRDSSAETSPDDSTYTAALRDSSGSVIAVVPVQPEPALVEDQAHIDRLAEAGIDADTPFWWAQFSVLIDDDTDATDVVIRRDDDVLATAEIPSRQYRQYR